MPPLVEAASIAITLCKAGGVETYEQLSTRTLTPKRRERVDEIILTDTQQAVLDTYAGIISRLRAAHPSILVQQCPDCGLVFFYSGPTTVTCPNPTGCGGKLVSTVTLKKRDTS